MELDRVVEALEGLAPLRLAASWDNVGLLVRGDRGVARVGLCIDLTEPVLDELERADCDLIVAYHPAIFKGLKRLAGRSPAERVVGRLLRAGRHLYSPHTALDAAAGGMAEWLAGAVGPAAELAPIEPDLREVAVGAGRIGRLAEARTVGEVVRSVKEQLGLAHVRVAGPLDLSVRRFAVCPGAGGSLFEQVRGVDLLLTGEMRHHDVLERVALGGAVVLTDHTHSERGYLPRFAGRLGAALGPGVALVVSKVDDDPLRVL